MIKSCTTDHTDLTTFPSHLTSHMLSYVFLSWMKNIIHSLKAFLKAIWNTKSNIYVHVCSKNWKFSFIILANVVVRNFCSATLASYFWEFSGILFTSARKIVYFYFSSYLVRNNIKNLIQLGVRLHASHDDIVLPY
jgi:hypothetical protein